MRLKHLLRPSSAPSRASQPSALHDRLNAGARKGGKSAAREERSRSGGEEESEEEEEEPQEGKAGKWEVEEGAEEPAEPEEEDGRESGGRDREATALLLELPRLGLRRLKAAFRDGGWALSRPLFETALRDAIHQQRGRNGPAETGQEGGASEWGGRGWKAASVFAKADVDEDGVVTWTDVLDFMAGHAQQQLGVAASSFHEEYSGAGLRDAR